MEATTAWSLTTSQHAQVPFAMLPGQNEYTKKQRPTHSEWDFVIDQDTDSTQRVRVSTLSCTKLSDQVGQSALLVGQITHPLVLGIGVMMLRKVISTVFCDSSAARYDIHFPE